MILLSGVLAGRPRPVSLQPPFFQKCLHILDHRCIAAEHDVAGRYINASVNLFFQGAVFEQIGDTSAGDTVGCLPAENRHKPKLFRIPVDKTLYGFAIGQFIGGPAAVDENDVAESLPWGIRIQNGEINTECSSRGEQPQILAIRYSFQREYAAGLLRNPD